MVLIGRIFKCSDDQVTVEGCYRIPPLPFPFLHPTEVRMMGFDLMEICSMEVTLFCVFVCKGDLVLAAKESFQSTGRECLVSGLEANHLKCQEAGITLWRVRCKTDLVFLDRGSLVLSSHLCLVISHSEADLFPFPFVFRLCFSLLQGGVLP